MIRNILIKGFRGISTSLPLSCGRITLLSGQNGLGKTTFFDAIDWCIFGSSWRLGHEKEALKNLYVTTEPSVELWLETNGHQTHVRRTIAGAFINEESVTDRGVIETFIRDPDVFGPYARNLEGRVRRLVYLPQADVRELVAPESVDVRNATLQALLGVPNASLLQSGLRRAAERISQRRDELSGKLAQLEQERSELEPKITIITGDAEREREYVMAEARTLLGRGVEQLISIDVLLGLVTKELSTCQEDITRLRETVVLLARNRERRTSLFAVQELRQTELRTLDGTVVTSQTLLAEAEGAAQSNNQEVKSLEEERKRLDSIRANWITAQGTLAEIRQLQEDENNSLQQVTDSDARIAGLEALKTTYASSSQERILTLAELRLQSAELTRSIQDLEGKNERAQQRIALSAELSSVSTETVDLVNQIAALDVAAKDRNDVIVKVTSLAAGVVLYDKLDAPLGQITKAISSDPPLEHTCPLCGADHETAASLLETIARTAATRSQRKSAKQRAAQELIVLQTEAKEAETERSALGARLHALEARKRDIENQVAQISDTTVDTDAVAAIRQKLNEVNAVLNEAIRDQDELGSEIDRIEKEIRQVIADSTNEKRSAAIAREKREERLRRLQLQNSTEEDLQKDILETNSQLAAVDEQLRLQRDQLRIKREELDRLRSSLASAHKERGNAAAKLKEIDEELKELQSEAKRRASFLNKSDEMEDEASLLTTARQRVIEVELREKRLRDLEASLKQRQITEDALVNRKALEQITATRHPLEQQASELDRAHTRLKTINEAVQARADLEGRDALGRYRSSIQTCLDALYPHKHLNQFVIEQAAGHFALTDSRLRVPVQPDLYTSTGQLNVLALAVFLGIASAQSVTMFDFLLLDEPVQNLDDVHFLALVTLLKRVALTSQVVISTADRNIAELIHRQMESTWHRTEQDYVHHHWRGFLPDGGPDVEQVSVRTSAVA